MTESTEQALRPIEISGSALRDMTIKVREWSNWPRARLFFGPPVGPSNYASCEHDSRTIRVEPETTLLNPNRVLLTITPFRLRQEAVMTGCLLHEAAHARFSHWQPLRYDNPAVLLHSDGAECSPAALELARTCEEPRIEGLFAAKATAFGAHDLGWTMRAMAAKILPLTVVSDDPDQAVMDVVCSWVLRAGRQHALITSGAISTMPDWVETFDDLVYATVLDHLDGDRTGADRVMQMLIQSVTCSDNTGSTMIDLARDILVILFPNNPNPPMPGGGGCGETGQGGEAQPSQGESGEGEPGEGTGEAQGADESDEQGSGGGEGDEESDEGSDGSGEGEGEGDQPAESEMAKALREMETDADEETYREGEAKAASAPAREAGEDKSAQSAGSGGAPGGGEYRPPMLDERETARNAERFLRGLIEPTESSKVLLTEAPAATVDGAALAAWRAGGQVRDPHFFRRTRREVTPAPPVNVAILVDVSGSMGILQKPSAVLSWALSKAALDLRNFAGRGVQIRSTLIHWGSTARVIARDGEVMRGIYDAPCREGTTALGEAMRLAEEQIPGLFTISDKASNSLIVHFTDWDLSGMYAIKAAEKEIGLAMRAGVNMLSVMPHESQRRSSLPGILNKIGSVPGRSSTMVYDRDHPERVWDEAARALS